jgi:hypothetical protein
MRWARNIARMGEMRNAYIILVGKPEGKRPLGRPRRRWKGNIRLDIRDVWRGGVDGMHLAQYKDCWISFVNTVMNFRFP